MYNLCKYYISNIIISQFYMRERNETGFAEIGDIRRKIISGNIGPDAFRKEFGELYEKYAGEGTLGYDELDSAVNMLLQIGKLQIPTAPRERGSDNLVYEPTPARLIYDMIIRSRMNEHDVLYDIGAGIGRVAVLANLLSGARANAVEYEPVYCEKAEAIARGLNLGPEKVNVIQGDARDVDYSEGTVFYLFNPFGGKTLEQVIEKLRQVAEKKNITICALGPCTVRFAQEAWLKKVEDVGGTDGKNMKSPMPAYDGRVTIYKSV